ncbi:TonB-dependent vitamin B12 receptor [Denitromonas sp.]|uniref:TonB-dependent vitamin B12 receptor n=1 Tax=Denitromonas sp. TaxID=2734609 RepID=UPI002AFE1390|nr:TonB-dependent vitamin B12 receptor [Denitromonas sp.]
MRLCLSAAALAVSCAFPLVSMAADAVGDTVVVTATRTARTVDESLAAVTVITQADIERLQARSVPDLLRGQAGLSLTNNGGRGKQTSVFMRGTESDHVVVLIDGVKVGSATAGSAAFQDMPVDMIERIEIVRGPRSSLYGSEAIGGVIQIFTKRGGGALRPSGSVGFGSKGVRKATFGLDGGGDQGWVSLNLSHDATDGFNACRAEAAGKGGCFTNEPDRDGYQNLSGSVRAGYRFDGGAEVNVNWMRTQATSDFDGSSQNESDSVQEVFGGRFSFSPLAAWKMTLGAGVSTDNANNYKDDVFKSSFDTERTTLSWQNDITLDENHLLTFGLDHQDDEITSTTAYPESSRTNDGVFALYQGAIGRHDYQVSLRSDDDERYGRHNTGAIAWGYTVSEALRLTASYGTAFKAPTFNELYFPFYGNTELEPERSRTVEFGLSGRAGWGYWSANLFQTHVDDLIGYDASLFKANNISEARIRGVEGVLGTQLAQWDLRTSVTLLDPRDASGGANDGNLLPRRAKQTLRVDADRDYGRFSVGASVLAASHRYDEVANTNRLGGYGVVDLRAEYKLAADWRLQGTIGNVFDHEYETARFYNQEGRSVFVTLKYQPKR